MDNTPIRLLGAYGVIKPCDGSIISLCVADYLIDGVRVTVVETSRE